MKFIFAIDNNIEIYITYLYFETISTILIYLKLIIIRIIRKIKINFFFEINIEIILENILEIKIIFKYFLKIIYNIECDRFRVR